MFGVIIIILWSVVCADMTDSNMVKLVVKVKDEFKGLVDAWMGHFNFTFYRKIIDGIYTYANTNPDICTDINIILLQRIFDGKVEYIYRSRNMYATFSPREGMRLEYEVTTEPSFSQTQECAHWVGSFVDIHDIWKRNITGRGVVVAIVDNGIDDQDITLRTKINKLISYNFVKDTDSSLDSPRTVSGHGDAYARLIVGDREPSELHMPCGCGISPEVTIADLKVGEWSAIAKQHLIPSFDGETLSQGLAAHQDEIDIYCNSWELDPVSVDVQSYIEDILHKGFHEGRNGKGNVFIFPAGSPGNDFASIYTITVGWIETGGSVRSNTFVNAATLVSVFTNVNTSSKTTTETKVVQAAGQPHFDVSSTSTAIMSGIIALALQTNSYLTARDIKHLLVQSASFTGLPETQDFKQNGAGYHFHKVLGFGYPDVNKMLSHASNWNKLPSIHTFKVIVERNFTRAHYRNIHVQCEQSRQCSHSLEQLRLKAEIDMPGIQAFTIVVTSPCGTSSILLEQSNTSGNLQVLKWNFLSNHFWGEDPTGLWMIAIDAGICYLKPSSCHLNVLEMTFDTTGSNDRLAETKTYFYGIKQTVVLCLLIALIITIIAICYYTLRRCDSEKCISTDDQEFMSMMIPVDSSHLQD